VLGDTLFVFLKLPALHALAPNCYPDKSQAAIPDCATVLAAILSVFLDLEFGEEFPPCAAAGCEFAGRA